MATLYERKMEQADFPVKVAEMEGADSFLYHWHEEIEVIVCMKGEVLAGIEGKPCRLQEREVLLIPPKRNHCLFPSETISMRRVLMFSTGFLFSQQTFEEDEKRFFQVPLHSKEWSKEAQEKAGEILEHICTEFQGKKAGWREEVIASLYHFCVLVLRKLPQTEGWEQTGSHRKVPLAEALEYLTKHYQENISLKSCAEAIGFHEGYLSALFKKQVGVSFHQYVQSLRIKRAQWLLLQTDCSVEEAAEGAGFQSVKTFHRVFRETCNCSPGVYRKQEKEADAFSR